jgi:acyl-CoA reductase-like NAD-dependent aldehyde dehydrogenase
MSTTSTDVRSYGHFIDGQDVSPGDALIERHAPGSGALVARFADGTAADAQAAVAAARRTFDDGVWRRTSGAERARVLNVWADAVRERQEDLARLDAEEVGKPMRLARGDVGGVIAHLEYAAALALEGHGDAYTNIGPQFLGVVVREPVGVAGLIVPWNFPALIYSQKVPYALAAGCSVVVKPSEFTSSSALEISRLAGEAGLPDGVLNVVTGYGHTVGQAIVEHPDVDFVSFTGSTPTGRRVAETAAKTPKRVGLELGSKSANIVFADADLDDAVDGALFAVFFNTGQCCVSGARLLVQDSIADAFVERLVQRTRELRVGPPSQEDADLGALINEDHAEKVLGYIASAKEEGAELLTGGNRVEGDGIFVEATVFDGVQPHMRIYREEVFGPVLGVTRFKDVDEAIALANDSTYGLANSVWSRDVDTALTVSRALQSGMVWVNTTIDGGPQMPFGGVKGSGYGREMGRAGLEEYTETKSIVLRTGKRDPFFA